MRDRRPAVLLFAGVSACGGGQVTPSVELDVPRADGGMTDSARQPDAAVPALADSGMRDLGGKVTPDASRSNTDAGAVERLDAGVALVPGSLEVSWMHGAANCAASVDPALQVHAYNATTYIIRQDKCRTFEAPFVYLLLGADTALLLDTGATNDTALRDTVTALVGSRALIVAHTHAHGDHVASDSRFASIPSASVVAPNVGAVQAAFDISTWPTDAAELALGERWLDVLPIPGHEQSHIAVYDRETGLLFTGDTLYPGLLFINDWTTYRASVERLAAFVRTHAVSYVLGAHVEMTSTAGVNYPYGTIFQPDEHVLELSAAHVLELDAALTALGPTPPSGSVAHDDFVIDPQ